MSSENPEHNWEKHYQLKLGDVFVEAGAFWCRYGRIASRKVGQTGRAILIEPSPHNIEVIENVVREEGLANVTLIKKAVWSDKGKKKFCVWGNPAGYRLAIPSDEEVIEVEVDTIDNILDELNVPEVSLLAADVEGTEVQLVRSCERHLEDKKILNIAIGAYHNPLNPGEIINYLTSKGYCDIKYEDGVVFAHV